MAEKAPLPVCIEMACGVPSLVPLFAKQLSSRPPSTPPSFTGCLRFALLRWRRHQAAKAVAATPTAAATMAITTTTVIAMHQRVEFQAARRWRRRWRRCFLDHPGWRRRGLAAAVSAARADAAAGIFRTAHRRRAVVPSEQMLAQIRGRRRCIRHRTPNCNRWCWRVSARSPATAAASAVVAAAAAAAIVSRRQSG